METHNTREWKKEFDKQILYPEVEGWGIHPTQVTAIEDFIHHQLQKARQKGEKDGIKMVNAILYAVDENKEGDITDHSLSEMFDTKLEAFWYGQRQYELDTRQSIEELLAKLDQDNTMNTKHTDSVEAIQKVRKDVREEVEHQILCNLSISTNVTNRSLIRPVLLKYEQKLLATLQATQKPQTTDSVEAAEEIARALSQSIRYSCGKGQYDTQPDCQAAYLNGVETAIAMMYIDLTGGHKSKGVLGRLFATHSQQVEEAVRKMVDKTRVLVRKYGTRMTDGEFKAFMKELSALTPNHQD